MLCSYCTVELFSVHTVNKWLQVKHKFNILCHIYHLHRENNKLNTKLKLNDSFNSIFPSAGFTVGTTFQWFAS